MMWFTKPRITPSIWTTLELSKYPGKRHHKKGENYDQPFKPLVKTPDYRNLKAEKIMDFGIFQMLKPIMPKNSSSRSFPIELVERCILAYTNKSDLVLDPFAGVGTTMLGALMHERRAIGCELKGIYGWQKNEFKTEDGTLPYRPLGKPIHTPAFRKRESCKKTR